MSRPKRYETNALKQKAYRERKRINQKNWDKATVLAYHQKPVVEVYDEITKKSKMEELREMVANVSKEPAAEPTKPLIFRDDYGRVISEGQWEKWQEKKRRAKEKGFTYDDYSQ